MINNSVKAIPRPGAHFVPRSTPATSASGNYHFVSNSLKSLRQIHHVLWLPVRTLPDLYHIYARHPRHLFRVPRWIGVAGKNFNGFAVWKLSRRLCLLLWPVSLYLLAFIRTTLKTGASRHWLPSISNSSVQCVDGAASLSLRRLHLGRNPIWLEQSDGFQNG